MKYSIYLQLFSAGLCGLLGLVSSFIPQELSMLFQVEISGTSILLIKGLGVFYISLAMLNYMVRKITLGGIYGRPIIVTNLSHYGIGTILLLKELSKSDEPYPYIFIFIAIYCLMSLGYFKALQFDPTKSHEV